MSTKAYITARMVSCRQEDTATAMTEERLKVGCAETEPTPGEEAAAREEQRLKAIREGRGMFRGSGTTVEDFMRERREETEREETRYDEYLRRKAAARER